jgi:hypothetical protein
VLKWTIYRALDFAFEFIDPHDGDRDFFLFATRKFTFSRSLTKNNFNTMTWTARSSTQEDCRQYLLGETEMLRSRCDHQAESLELTALQMDELEDKHAMMGEQWCRTLAAQEAIVDCYMG